MPYRLLLAKQCLLLTVFGPVHSDDLTKEFTIVHIEDGMLTIFNILVLDKSEVARDTSDICVAVRGLRRHYDLIEFTEWNEGCAE